MRSLTGTPLDGGGNTLRHGDRIVQITGAKSVHRHGWRDSNVLRPKSVLGIESFFLGDNGGEKTRGVEDMPMRILSCV